MLFSNTYWYWHSLKSNSDTVLPSLFLPCVSLTCFIFRRARDLSFMVPHLHRRHRDFLHLLCIIEIPALEHATPTLLLYLSKTNTGRSERKQTVIIEHYECAIQLPSIWKLLSYSNSTTRPGCCSLDLWDCLSTSNSAVSYKSK